MSTIPIEVSTEQLLRAVERLPAEELAAFAAQVVALRAQRTAPHLTKDETTLLLQINAGLLPEAQARFDARVAKRETESITPDELQEMITLTEQIEQQEATRVVALHALAQLCQTTVPNLMSALGFASPDATRYSSY